MYKHIQDPIKYGYIFKLNTNKNQTIQIDSKLMCHSQ